MKIPPTILETPRLILRPFVIGDASDVQRLAAVREVAATTLNVPHPYEDGMAQSWIVTHAAQRENGQSATFAITLRESGELIGAISLGITGNHADGCAELGYWLGVPFWNNGYTTEAGHAVLRFGFETLELTRIFASHLSSNPASGRVQEKIGMQYEGCFRSHYVKWGERHDAILRGILVDEWHQANS